MKLILSRKGVDSSIGGFASPIFPDGSLWSVPIPDPRSVQRYRDLKLDFSPGKVVRDLSRGRMTALSRAHIDPDLVADQLPRQHGWRGVFGQAGAALRHLQHHDIGRGDLFLFFGWFRAVELRGVRWVSVTGAPDLHVIYGWLRVGDVIDANADGPSWANYHPHTYGQFGANNRLFLAAPDGPCGAPGAGVFKRLSAPRILTQEGQSRSHWQLPGWFHPAGRDSVLSYHSDQSRWCKTADHALLRSAARGQEFVLDVADYPQCGAWLKQLFIP